MGDYKFEGWVAEDTSAAKGKMVWKEFQPKTWEERDLDIKVTHSAICSTDLSVMKCSWGPTNFPCVTGHEVVGEVVRVGTESQDRFKVGDIVGFGSTIDTCGTCDVCVAGNEHFCADSILTYGSVHKNGDKSLGGHATYTRVPSGLVFKLPNGLAPEHAAPLFCAGITVYRPLKEAGVGPGKKVGVAGLGGLGHVAVLFAKAMGADEVVAISRSSDKKGDATELGATDFVATGEDPEWATKNAGRLDVIINNAGAPKMPIDGYLQMLKNGGTLIQLGAPSGTTEVNLFPLIMGQKRIVGSIIGNRHQISEMLDLAAEKQIKPWVQTRPMSDANQAIVDMDANKARYRYVLTN